MSVRGKKKKVGKPEINLARQLERLARQLRSGVATPLYGARVTVSRFAFEWKR